MLVKDIDLSLSIIEPGMVEHLLRRESFGNILLQHGLHQVTRQLADGVTILDLLLVKLMGQVSNLIRFERHIAIEDSVKAHTSRPDVDRQTFITNFLNDLRCDVSWSAALLKQKFLALHATTDAEIANLDVALAIEEDIVEFDVSMNDANLVHVCNALHDLLE